MEKNWQAVLEREEDGQACTRATAEPVPQEVP